MPTGTFPWDKSRVVPLVLGIGMNYRSHAAELGKPVPTKPVVFSKGPNTICGPGDPIILPKGESKVDYEGELAVIIGPNPCKDVTVDEALMYVEGYTVANDVSGRQWQFDEFNGGQWVVSKSFDNFCPIGPSMIPASQVSDPQALQITTKLNGEVVQDCSTSDMVFPVKEIISFLSQGTTLLPGTVVLTGTPSGVGHGKKIYLKTGDKIDIDISSIGVLTNTAQPAA